MTCDSHSAVQHLHCTLQVKSTLVQALRLYTGRTAHRGRRGIILYYIYLFIAIGLSPGGSGYFTCKQNMKLVTTRFKSGGLHEKHVVATWNVGNHLSICL